MSEPRSIRLSIWRGEQCDLRVDCIADEPCHFEIKPNAGGDYVVRVQLPVRERAQASGRQFEVDQAAGDGDDGDRVDDPYRNAVGVCGKNELGHVNYSVRPQEDQDYHNRLAGSP